jgi:hypothetical protein
MGTDFEKYLEITTGDIKKIYNNREKRRVL